MAFKDHAEFSPPASSDAIIWRYMDLAKFLSLIEKSALFFVRVDKLTQDPYEGFYTSLNIQNDHIQERVRQLERSSGMEAEKCRHILIDLDKIARESAKIERELTFVNSWHAQEHESAAMWNLYVKSHEGIAIESSYNRLIASLGNYEDFDIFIGMMKYIDYKNDSIPLGNGLTPFMYKRRSFEHEKELRALIWTRQDGKNMSGNPPVNKFHDDIGLYIPVNLEKLISRIFIAPTALPWTLELLESLVKKYDLKKEIVQSDLASTPMD